jgi:predicted MPP superfamily phosphohydrolase
VRLQNITSIEQTEPPKPKRFVFVSDLHFDIDKKISPNCPLDVNISTQKATEFIKYVKNTYPDDILCLAGDYFDDYQKSLSFILAIEKAQITGFFILGNHDYWNNATLSHEEILLLFKNQTKNNRYFKMLATGEKYFIDDTCIIGDTGWTSFRRNNRNVPIVPFMNFPEKTETKDFDPERIRKLHEEWIDFANSVLTKEQSVIIITHNPMTDFTKKSRDCWWSSQTSLIETNNYWNIFGHTHQLKAQRKGHYVSEQRGYSGSQTKHFGILQKVSSNYELSDIDRQIILKRYSPLIKITPSKIKEIESRGYKRCSSNKSNLTALAHDPESYLKKIIRVMEDYLKKVRAGYVYIGRTGISDATADKIRASVNILRNPRFDNFDSIREFITAAVITGYVYNNIPSKIPRMRRIDDSDIVRFYLMFATIKKYQIPFNEIETLRKHPKQRLIFYPKEDKLLSPKRSSNENLTVNRPQLNINLPVINSKYSLSTEEAKSLLAPTQLLLI